VGSADRGLAERRQPLSLSAKPPPRCWCARAIARRRRFQRHVTMPRPPVRR
jgi:hypothetical protein